MSTAEVWLAVIALAVVVIAAIQVAAVVFAARAARRVGEVVSRLEQDVRPIVVNLQAISQEARPILANLQAMSADAARATSAAAAQVERAEKLIGDLSKRLDDTAAALQHTIIKPARHGFALFQGLKVALGALRAPQGRDAAHKRTSVEEEDALFIG